MKSRISLMLALLVWLMNAAAQPGVRWQRSLGGEGSDQLRSLIPLANDGLLLLGEAGPGTNTVKRSEGFGGLDFWVVAMNAEGGVLWERAYGGSGWDTLWSAAATANGGFLLGGISSSTNSGTKTSVRFGEVDFWVTRIDATGNPLWDRSFGGTQVDRLAHVEPLPDGGFLLSGYSDSDLDGNKSVPSRGRQDGWLIRLDAEGEIVWQKALGGTGDDSIAAARQLPDGGFLLVGSSDSPPGGDKGDGAHGLGDVWIVRLDAGGNKLWDRTYGGSNVEYSHDVVLLPGGDAVVLATSLSGISGNKTSPSRGGGATADAYVIRIDDQGNRVWEQTYGGSSVDLLIRGAVTDDGLVLAGYSSSKPGGNKTSPHFGWDDLWLVRIDLDGGLLWETALGSGGSEQARALAWLPDGDVVIGGHLLPINGQSPALPTYGSDDFYLVRVAGDRPRLTATQGPPVRVTLQGVTNVWHRTDHSSDLQTWTPWSTNRLEVPSLELTDVEGTPARFYRASLVPAP